MTQLNRRTFHQLTAAAFGGMLTGTLSGCPAKPTEPKVDDKAPTAPVGAEAEATSLLMQEKHVCRGLNMCKNSGASGENACAGQGDCATFVHHVCGQQNDCKGQGGCGSDPGENACKGQGGCGVPLMDHAWDTARANFEAAMKAAGKDVGPAPEKKSS